MAVLRTVTEGPDEMLNILRNAGADVNTAANSEKFTPLMVAVNHCREWYVETLLTAGADVNTGDYKG